MPTKMIGKSHLRYIKKTENHRLGKDNEDRLWVIFQTLMASMEKPIWLKSVRRATRYEDLCLATDFVLETHDIGQIFVNAKSSFYHADRFNGERRSRHVVAIPMNAVLASHVYEAEDYVLDIIWDEYKNIRKMRGDEI